MNQLIFIWCFLLYSYLYFIIYGKSINYNGEDVVSYRDFKLYQITPRTDANLQILEILKSLDFDFWKLSKLLNDTSEIVINPNVEETFLQLLDRNNIEYTLQINDLEEIIQNERSFQKSKYYRRYNEIVAYINLVTKLYPNNTKIDIIGKSYENRKIPVITLSSDINSNAKRSILIDAGIHAREWIAPATALYTIEMLLDNLRTDQSLFKTYNWIIIPIMNPDGYEYTHTKDRLWRKSRKPNKKCIGTDINRNFNFHWDGAGTSSDECSEEYKGDTPFSESESKALKYGLKKFGEKCDMYLTLHSYGNYLLYPWGFTSDLPNTYQDLDKVAIAGANAIKQYSGTIYKVGSVAQVLYQASATSGDYAFGISKIPISLVMELSGGGLFGFDPFGYQVKPIIEESWVGIKAMVLQVMELNFTK